MHCQPLISVVMGIYNCADTLSEAVECILKQTYANWELIMCDDGSTDNTYEIAKKLADFEPRIILIKNEQNLTLAPTLNKCISYASGEYIARMDGDDICSPNRLEKEVSFLQKNPEFSFVSCQMNLFDKDGIYRCVHYKEYPSKKELLISNQFCHAGCMIRAEAIKAIGGYSTNKNRQRVEDYDLWVRLYAAGHKGYNIQDALYSMRDDRHAMKRRTFSNRLNESRVKNLAWRLYKLPFHQYRYVIIPIVKWLVPGWIYKIIHHTQK